MTWFENDEQRRAAEPDEAFRLLTYAHFRALAKAMPIEHDALWCKYQNHPEYKAHYANLKPGERAAKLRQVCDAAEALEAANANLKAVWGTDFKPLTLLGTKPKE